MPEQEDAPDQYQDRRETRSDSEVTRDYLKEHIERAHPIVRTHDDFQQLVNTASIIAFDRPGEVDEDTKEKFEKAQVPAFLEKQLATQAAAFDLNQQTQLTLQAEKKAAHAEKMATTDELTGLMKRNVYVERLEAEANRINREFRDKSKEGPINHEDVNQVLVVGKLDIDDYGMFNDLYGHATGNAVLEQLGTRLKNSSRKSDIFARLGGEEIGFADPFLINDVNQVDSYVQSGERIRRMVEELRIQSQTRLGHRDNLTITASVGTTEYVPGETVEDAMQRADLGERIAKALGKDRAIHVTRANGDGNMQYILDLTKEDNIKDTRFPNKLYTYLNEAGWREILVDEYAEVSYEFATPPEGKKQKLFKLIRATPEGDIIEDLETTQKYHRIPHTDDEGNISTTMTPITA